MNRCAVFVLSLVLAIHVSACAGSAGGEASADAGAARVRRNPNVLTAEELSEPSIISLTLMDAIQRLRPNWVRARGATSISAGGDVLPRVMINESPSQLDVLRSLRPSDVTSAEFMSGADATTLYGTGYVNGLIKVKTGAR
jgi:hypothetical protein